MNEQKIRGSINKVFYAGPAFSAGRLVTPEGRNISFAGNLYAIEGQPVVLAGHWDKHPEYGRQFKVDHVEIEMPSDPGGLAQYLAQHPEIRGIGLARAWKIASELGEEFEEVLLNDPERLARTGGVSLDIVENLRHVWNRTRGLNAAMTWFSAFGLTHHQVTTLMEKLGNNAVAILKSDPYRIIREIKGLGFKKVDQIALKMGTPKENTQRIQAGIHHCVFEALDQGDCWVESEDLIDRANTLLIMDCLDSRERIERELDHLIGNESLECHDLGGRVGIALPSIYRQESQLALWFERGREEVFRVGPIEMDKLIARYGSTLNEKQEQAVRNALRYRVSLISGGAGVGKSFCVSVIEAICRNLGLDVTLTAPTGKAAKRIEELSGCEAKTIHRLLGYDGRTFAKGPDDPIETDVLIVDELSMVDVTLAWRLFRALDLSRTSVILVGDHNQLPPVGPGNVLRDLIRTKALPGTILEVCLRQAGVLKENSTAILKGEVRKTSEKRPDGRSDWYVVDHFTDPLGVTGCLRELFSNILEEKLGFDLLRDVQVLTPTHKGPLGTQALNEEIQRLVQRKRFGVNVPPHLPNHRPPLLKGDKVIQTRNNYTLGVMNGTVGLVRNIWPDGTYVFEFDGEEIAIKKNDAALRDIQLGFALSVHRAQGSEFPCAIVIMHKSSWFMNRREVLYTAVTRARKSVILLGDRSGIREAATRGSAQQRTTWLSYLLPNAHCLSM